MLYPWFLASRLSLCGPPGQLPSRDIELVLYPTIIRRVPKPALVRSGRQVKEAPHMTKIGGRRHPIQEIASM
jgi:hypothetical protein